MIYLKRMFLDIYVKGPVEASRDDFEEAISEVLGRDGEIVGGGSGLGSFNIDVELFADSRAAHEVMQRVAIRLKSLGAPQDTILKTTDPDASHTLAEVLAG